jgi:predicted HicB family RNase H-like nuclease
MSSGKPVVVSSDEWYYSGAMPAPKREYMTLNLRLYPEVHDRATKLAFRKRMSLNALINQALMEFVTDEEADHEDD